MGLKAAVQALKKAEELKARVSRHDDLLNNSEVWSDQQQLQTVYHQVLVLDLEYALDKKVEQELWTLGFKNHIAALQHLSKDKKNPKRSEYQALLSWCLEAASGFYLTLLQELCTAFELDLPFRRRGSIYGQSQTKTAIAQVNLCSGSSEQPQKSSCLYICQYCLVHLGDIARYRSQRKQAESFYRHAILLSPSSGQPYNQLALLEASRGDKLATVFHYVRSISVKHPFPAAATNLANTLSASIDHQEALLTEVHTKLSIMEFLTMFLRVHALLHLANDLDQAELYVKSLNATFTALVATHAFSSVKLIQMTAINLYALRHTLDSFSTEQLTTDELRVKNLILDLLAGAFSAYLLPIYTMPNDASLLDYYALSAIKLTLDWIKTDPDVLNESVFTKRLQIWPSLCKLLNILQQTVTGECDMKNFDKIPLPEDRDLQCFLPLVNAYKDLDFTICVNPNYDKKFFNNLRVNRLVHLSVWLSTQNIDNNVVITAKKINNNVVFEPCIQQPDPTTDLLNELKHFNIKDNLQKSPSKSSIEKRGGILKPQGSLEKAREEREREQSLISATNIPSSVIELNESNIRVNADTVTTATKLKRNRQNVAMQALAKKVEENSKQVTFVTTEPNKTKVIETKQLPINPFQNQNQMLQPPPAPAVPPPPPPPPMSFKQNVPYQNAFPFQNPVPPQTNFNPTYHARHFPNFDLPPNYQQPDQPFKSNWLHNDKLPMPPSTWTSWPHNSPSKNNNIPRPPPPLNNELFHQKYPFNAPSNTNNYDNTSNTPMYNNTMSLWNSGPNFQPNLQMIFNQQSKQSTSNPAPLFNEPVMPDHSQSTNSPVSSGGYSLFNSNWAPNLTVHSSLKYNNQNVSDRGPPLMRQQSLFSGPGPSPLERLLQQQKQQRGPPNSNTTTHKEDT